MKLVTLVVTLSLITSAVSGEELTRVCKVIWEKYANVQVKGLTKQDSIKTELECKAACEASEYCWNIDFNFHEDSCWHGTVHKPENRTVDSSVHHWDMTKDCTEFQKVKTECVMSWEKYENTQVKFLIQQVGITTEDDCKKACEGKDDCWNIDFNFHSVSCWHGSVHKPTSRVPDLTVNHWDLSKICKAPSTPIPSNLVDCGAIRNADPSATTGTYGVIIPGVTGTVQVYCDMDTACGGWTVFQRRKDGSQNFTRNWADYKNGFGQLNGEFWLGNNYLTLLTSGKSYRLRVDLEDWAGKKIYAEYSNFHVANETSNYKMSFLAGSFKGNTGDAMSGAVKGVKYSHNGMKFTTIDKDNDNNAGANCATAFHGGWWYNSCHSFNPNGQYNNTKASGEGINWNDWFSSYKFVELKIRAE
jgi:ficolin